MIQTFEDLVAWQKARELAAGVHRMTAGRRFERRVALRDQVERASISVMSNLAEGFDRYRPAEFIHFLGLRPPDSGLGTHTSGSKLPVKAAEGEQ